MSLYELLVGQFEPKKMSAAERADKINARGTKIGIAKPGEKITKADVRYSKKGFKW